METNEIISNELNCSDVYRSVSYRYTGSLAKFYMSPFWVHSVPASADRQNIRKHFNLYVFNSYQSKTLALYSVALNFLR